MFGSLTWGVVFSQEMLDLSWPNDGPPPQVALDKADPFALYEAGLYWTVVTFTTIGYGDFNATTIGERAFIFFYVFFNVWILALIVGTVTSWLQKAEASRAKLAAKLDDAKAYCAFRGLPRDLAGDLQRYHRFNASAQGYEVRIKKRKRREENTNSLDFCRAWTSPFFGT